MKALIQRVTHASVLVNDSVTGSIDEGIVVFVGMGKGDSLEEVRELVAKIPRLRIFEDEEGKMNLSLTQVEGQILLIPEFTLYGDCSQGRRPSFGKAMDFTDAKDLFQKLLTELEANYDLTIEKGKFGSNMEVTLTNDGPVTFLLES